jgi:hypothetical protein
LRLPPSRPPRAPALAAALALALAAAGCGLRGGRLVLAEENDSLNLGKLERIDRDYTQGAFVAFTLTDEDTPRVAADLARALPQFDGKAPVHLGFLASQQLWTPADTDARFPIPDDRPYAASLWGAVALQSPVLDPDPVRRRDRVDHLQVEIGVLGPRARGEEAQNSVHAYYQADRANGWEWQVADETVVQGTAERRWRLLAGEIAPEWRWDVVPRARLRAGTFRVEGAGGALVRAGWNLPRDFGPMLVDASGLTRGAPRERLWLALHGGGEVRLVAHDATLGRNTFDGARTATPEPVAGTYTVGASAGWGSFSLVFEQHWITPEFRERSRNHRITTVMAIWTQTF